MLSSVVRFFWPDLTDKEVKKFSLLSLALLFIIGTYWMMRILKDSLFVTIGFPEALGWLPNQGTLYLKWAKTGSVFVVIAMVLIYSKLVDLFKKHQLFYIYCTIYGIIFSIVAGLLFIRHYMGDAALGKWVLAGTAWTFYFAIESFGSIVVALFWSFVASITTSESAKKGYPLIIAGAQIGSITGSGLNTIASKVGTLWPYFLLAAFSMLIIMAIIYRFMHTLSAHDLVGNPEAHKTEKKKEGFFEGFVSGLVLLATRPYLLGILVVSTFYEVINTMVDLQMKGLGYSVYGGELAYNEFLGYFGLLANCLALVMALLGTRYLIKRFGLRFCLLAFPVALGSAVVGLYLFYQLNPDMTPFALLWAMVGVGLIGKALSYSLNNPSKEVMYIPTSKDAKFKSKSWIDSFGGRTAKAAGSQISGQFATNLPGFMMVGTLISLGLVGVWALAAFYVGTKFNKLTAEGKIVE